MKIPFVSFLPMEHELDKELRDAFERVYKRSWYIDGMEDAAFEKAFGLYETAFPLHERRTREKQVGVMGHPEYHFTLIWEGEAFAGILLFWEGPDFRYVEHFAISEALRGGEGPSAGDRPAGGGGVHPPAAFLREAGLPG